MAKPGLSIISDGVAVKLKAMFSRAKVAEGWLNTVAYRTYQNAQRKRWMLENNHEWFVGGLWERLNPKYAEWKLRAYAGYPGAGSKMLIATNKLQRSVIGPGDDHRKFVSGTSLTVMWTTPYARFVDEARTVTRFSKVFYDQLSKKFQKYILSGQFDRGGL